VEALFRAYFTEDRDISNVGTLTDLVVEAGLGRGSAETLLKGEAGMEAISEAGELSRKHQVNGVPFFIVNNEITLSGAQPPEAFLDAFEQSKK
jgi:predicted DsbA family dithiol-disulfide isomerase